MTPLLEAVRDLSSRMGWERPHKIAVWANNIVHIHTRRTQYTAVIVGNAVRYRGLTVYIKEDQEMTSQTPVYKQRHGKRHKELCGQVNDMHPYHVSTKEAVEVSGVDPVKLLSVVFRQIGKQREYLVVHF